MDKTTEEKLLDEIFDVASSYGVNENTIEPELVALGVVFAVRELSWQDLKVLRAGIDRRVRKRNTDRALKSIVESATLNVN